MSTSRSGARGTTRDRGAVDTSVELLIGSVAVAAVLLLVVETAAHWHTRNVLADAAADGVRVAAGSDGSCAAGIATAHASVTRHGSTWADDVRIACRDGSRVTLTLTGRTPGLVGTLLGHRASVTSSTPKEQ